MKPTPENLQPSSVFPCTKTESSPSPCGNIRRAVSVSAVMFSHSLIKEGVASMYSASKIEKKPIASNTCRLENQFLKNRCKTLKKGLLLHFKIKDH